MIGDVGIHRLQHAHVVDAPAQIREDLAHLRPALAVLLELEWRLHQIAGLALVIGDGARQRLAVVLLQHRLVIEGVHLRRAAVHEQENNVLGLGLEIWNARAWDALYRSRVRPGERFTHQTGKAQHAEAAAHPAQRFPPRQRPASR